MINWIERLPAYTGSGLLLAADGGATNCRVVICDPDGTMRGYFKAHGRPTNARAVGEAVAAANLVFTVESAIADAGVRSSEIETALITSASVDTDARSALLSGSLAAAGLGAANVATVPDTMGCWASTKQLAPAVAVISGTGSVAIAADRDRGIWRRFGGWDFLLGDEGSGYALGRRALQETMLYFEGRSPAKALAEAVMARWGGDDPDGLPDAVHVPAIDKAWIASFARLVLDAAAAGDERASQLVDEEVSPLADAALAGVRVIDGHAGGGAVPLGLFGGIAKQPLFQERFRRCVSSQWEGEIEFIIPDHSALVGAAALGMIDRPLDERTEALNRLDASVDIAVAKADAAAAAAGRH